LVTSYLYTLSLHDALPIYSSGYDAASVPLSRRSDVFVADPVAITGILLASLELIGSSWPTVSPKLLYRMYLYDVPRSTQRMSIRSEEHTSELQSQSNLVCR